MNIWFTLAFIASTRNLLCHVSGEAGVSILEKFLPTIDHIRPDRMHYNLFYAKVKLLGHPLRKCFNIGG